MTSTLARQLTCYPCCRRRHWGGRSMLAGVDNAVRRSNVAPRGRRHEAVYSASLAIAARFFGMLKSQLRESTQEVRSKPQGRTSCQMPMIQVRSSCTAATQQLGQNRAYLAYLPEAPHLLLTTHAAQHIRFDSTLLVDWPCSFLVRCLSQLTRVVDPSEDFVTAVQLLCPAAQVICGRNHIL